MLPRSSLPLNFELTPPQFMDHDYLILRVLYQERSQDSPDTIFVRCERKPHPVDFGGGHINIQTWDSISFSSDLDRIHNQDKGKTIGLLHLREVKVRHVTLLLHIIRGRAEEHEAGDSNCWWFAEWFAEGRFFETSLHCLNALTIDKLS